MYHLLLYRSLPPVVPALAVTCSHRRPAGLVGNDFQVGEAGICFKILIQAT